MQEVNNKILQKKKPKSGVTGSWAILSIISWMDNIVQFIEFSRLSKNMELKNKIHKYLSTNLL